MKKERKRWIAESVGAVDLYATTDVSPQANAPLEGAAEDGGQAEPKPAQAAGTPLPPVGHPGCAADKNDRAAATDCAPLACYEDWSVCAALGIRRRVLIRLREGLVRGRDWGTVEGEIGMSETWCLDRGLDLSQLRKAGAGGLLSCVVAGFAPNPQIILGRSIEQGVVIPIHVRAASDFRKGMLIEAKRGFVGWSIAYGWPRRGY